MRYLALRSNSNILRVGGLPPSRWSPFYHNGGTIAVTISLFHFIRDSRDQNEVSSVYLINYLFYTEIVSVANDNLLTKDNLLIDAK